MVLEKLVVPLKTSEAIEQRLKQCLALTRAHIGAERGCLLVTQSGREQLLHDGDDSLRVKFPFSRRVVGEVMVRGSGVVSFDADRADLTGSSASMTLHGVRAALAAPIPGPEQQDLGVLYFDSRVGAGTFSNEHLELIKALVVEIGLALS